jgi:hypothetical protein
MERTAEYFGTEKAFGRIGAGYDALTQNRVEFSGEAYQGACSFWGKMKNEGLLGLLRSVALGRLDRGIA